LAFEACQQHLATAHANDYPEVHEEWEVLPIVFREAWEAGAQAVLAERDRLHSDANVPGLRAAGAGPVFNPQARGACGPLGEER
jgi:hypothetical protein